MTTVNPAKGVAGREYRLFLLAVGLVGLHIVDDNFLQPEPGTSAGDHLASGLVPIAVLAACAVVYPRLRAGARAYVSMTLGALAIAIGTPGMYHLVVGGASSDDYTGLLAIVAGIALLIAGPVILWKARRKGGSRRRRYLRRSLLTVGAVAIGLATFWFIVFPVGFPYIYTHVGQTATAPDLTVPSESVTVTTSDSLDLAATYVPSKNGAAVIVFPGATRVEEAQMIARHGYGVLLLEPRGQGASEGDTVRWAGTATCMPVPTTSRAVPTSMPSASGPSASRSAASSCSRLPRSRRRSRPSCPRVRAAVSVMKTCQARHVCSRSRTWP